MIKVGINGFGLTVLAVSAAWCSVQQWKTSAMTFRS